MDTATLGRDDTEGEKSEGVPVEAEVVDATDELVMFMGMDELRRKWLRVLTPLVDMRASDADFDIQVRQSYDQMQMAACEAVRRLLRAPLPGEEEDG